MYGQHRDGGNGGGGGAGFLWGGLACCCAGAACYLAGRSYARYVLRPPPACTHAFLPSPLLSITHLLLPSCGLGGGFLVLKAWLLASCVQERQRAAIGAQVLPHL